MNCDYTERYAQIKKKKEWQYIKSQRELRRSVSEF